MNSQETGPVFASDKIRDEFMSGQEPPYAPFFRRLRKLANVLVPGITLAGAYSAVAAESPPPAIVEAVGVECGFHTWKTYNFNDQHPIDFTITQPDAVTAGVEIAPDNYVAGEARSIIAISDPAIMDNLKNTNSL